MSETINAATPAPDTRWCITCSVYVTASWVADGMDEVLCCNRCGSAALRFYGPTEAPVPATQKRAAGATSDRATLYLNARRNACERVFSGSTLDATCDAKGGACALRTYIAVQAAPAKAANHG